MKTIAKRNEEYHHVNKMLFQLGYTILNECDGPNGSRLYFWAGRIRPGTLIVQAWKDRGIEMYQSDGIPSLWTELEDWLGSVE